jgi:hypothetical protein
VPVNALLLSKPHPRIICQLADDGTAAYTMLCDGHLCECGSTFTEAFDYFFKLFLFSIWSILQATVIFLNFSKPQFTV